MNADKLPLGELTDLDQTALGALAKRQDAMLARTIGWSKINTGSHNTDGLKAFAPLLAEAFGETEASVELVATNLIENIKANGEIENVETGPVVKAVTRPDAPHQVIFTGHYDTVFPKGTLPRLQISAAGSLMVPA